jgi:hypothetical protein
MYDVSPPHELIEADFHHFVRKVCMAHLVPGGTFSFFSSGPAVRPTRLAELQQRFSSIDCFPVKLAAVPPDWRKKTIEFVVPVAVR